jgi:hypothetical protein
MTSWIAQFFVVNRVADVTTTLHHLQLQLQSDVFIAVKSLCTPTPELLTLLMCPVASATPAAVPCGATPMPLAAAAAGWVLNGAPLNSVAWEFACRNVTENQTCSVAACGGAYIGTLSAVCQVRIKGDWQQQRKQQQLL